MVSMSPSSKVTKTLVEAVQRREFMLVDQMLANGVHVMESELDGWTALHEAAKNGYADLCTKLIALGADVNARNKYGDAPLNIAASHEKLDVCQLLVRAGADKHGLGFDNETPVHAAGKASLKILQMLVAEGADPGFCPPDAPADWLTPFQAAVKNGRVKDAPHTVRYMVLECGQSLDQVTLDGCTLEQLAGDDQNMQRLLRALRTELNIKTAVGIEGDAPAAPTTRRCSPTL